MIRLGQTMVERGWIGPAQFDLNFTLARVAPGTNVLAFVIGAGYAARGWLGGIVALFSLSAPAACIVVLLTLAYQRWSGSPLGHSVVTATAASIVGIIVGAAWLLAKPRVAKREYLRTAVLVLGALILSFWMPPLQIMAIGALLGYCWPERQT